MPYKLVHIGFGNIAVAERIVAVIDPDSAPVRRLKDEAREAGLLVDATQGRKTRSILIMDSRHVILSAIQPETIAARFENEDEDQKAE
ncbi:MAG: DUF370 domain-containing protein [Synergistes sp.]|nr:DUF370 domain-containing protein [Synergistes sp.]MCR5335044.1 DUF370 domain-containing protein [Synergistes sp.]